jgi:hypothetical protein
VDRDIWIVKVDQLGWVCVDEQQTVMSTPWNLALDEQSNMPPTGE